MKWFFIQLLAIIFIMLKLTDIVDWSWFWVLSPLWGATILGVVSLFVLALFAYWLDND